MTDICRVIGVRFVNHDFRIETVGESGLPKNNHFHRTTIC